MLPPPVKMTSCIGWRKTSPQEAPVTESFDNLESRLAGIRPRPLNPALESRIASALAEDAAAESPASPPHNRFFWSAVTSGAVAACVIAGVFLTEPGMSHPTPPSQMAGA